MSRPGNALLKNEIHVHASISGTTGQDILDSSTAGQHCGTFPANVGHLADMEMNMTILDLKQDKYGLYGGHVRLFLALHGAAVSSATNHLVVYSSFLRLLGFTPTDPSNDPMMASQKGR